MSWCAAELIARVHCEETADPSPAAQNHPINDPPAPFVCNTNALAFISALLDSAATDLAAGGTALPFAMPTGSSSNGAFDAPAAFLKVNHGLKGKVEFHRGMDHAKPNAPSFAAAIGWLNATFFKKETAADIFQSTLPIPKREFDARNVATITPSCS